MSCPTYQTTTDNAGVTWKKVGPRFYKWTDGWQYVNNRYVPGEVRDQLN